MRSAAGCLLLLMLACMLGCTSSPRYSGDTKPPRPAEAEPSPLPLESPTRIDIPTMDRAIAAYMKVPYQAGGTGKLGLDCSGFVYVVYRDYDGTRLPLTTRTLYRMEQRVYYDDLTYGDLVFFKTDKRKVSHVGIYLGQGKFVHASQSRGVVLDEINDDYWAERYAGARRIK